MEMQFKLEYDDLLSFHIRFSSRAQKGLIRDRSGLEFSYFWVYMKDGLSSQDKLTSGSKRLTIYCSLTL